MIHGDRSTVFMCQKHARNITCSVINSFQNVFVFASTVQKKHFSAVRFQNIAVSMGTPCVYYSHEHFLSPHFCSAAPICLVFFVNFFIVLLVTISVCFANCLAFIITCKSSFAIISPHPIQRLKRKRYKLGEHRSYSRSHCR